MVRFTGYLLLVAVTVSMNLHLPSVQMVAWTAMFMKFSRDVSIVEAAEKTFNGENPCTMCTAVDQAREESTAGQNPGSINARDAGEMRGELASLSELVFPPGNKSSLRNSDILFCPVDQPPPLLPPPIHA
jgi:hypothetical protein